jgi:hypothetical protein
LTFLTTYYFYNKDEKKYEKDITILIKKNDSLMHVFERSQKDNQQQFDELHKKIFLNKQSIEK